MFEAVAKILVVVVAAGILIRKKVIKQEYIKGLSEVTVFVLLPCLIFSKTINTFRPDETPGWWVLPLIGIGIPAIGLALGVIFFSNRPKHKKNILSVSAFQNAVYLVLPIGQLLFPEQFDTFALYCFLLVIGYMPFLWSIGKYFATLSKDNYSFKLKEVITPPLVANFTAVTIVLLNLHSFIPEFVIAPIELLGSATVPVATFILGATLGSISYKIWPKLSDILKVVLIRFILVPLIVIAILYSFGVDRIPELLAAFIVIQASAAPATNIIVMIRKYGGDAQQIGSMMLILYLAAILIMPTWMAVWQMLK